MNIVLKLSHFYSFFIDKDYFFTNTISLFNLNHLYTLKNCTNRSKSIEIKMFGTISEFE